MASAMSALFLHVQTDSVVLLKIKMHQECSHSSALVTIVDVALGWITRAVVIAKYKGSKHS
jgi:hypothetical protein